MLMCPNVNQLILQALHHTLAGVLKKTQQNTTLDNAQPQQHYTDWKEFDSF